MELRRDCSPSRGGTPPAASITAGCLRRACTAMRSRRSASWQSGLRPRRTQPGQERREAMTPASRACILLLQLVLLGSTSCRSYRLRPPLSRLGDRIVDGRPAQRTWRPTRSPFPRHEAATSRRSASAAEDAGGFVEDRRYRRKARGKSLKRDEAGLPAEKVYAPRPSAYGKPVVGGTGRTKRVRPQGEEREVNLNNAARLKVAGGVVKGRRLESPDVFLRPMMGKVKEALFNTLTGFGAFETGDARVLDLFSGSGSVGIEALSRGASHATFVDFAEECCKVSLRNAFICGFADQAKAVRGDVLDVLYNPRKFGLTVPYDIVVVTPPYEEVVYADLVQALAMSDLVVQDTIVVLEYPVELGCMPHAIGDGSMVGLRNRRYGRTVLGVWVYLPSGQHDDLFDSRPEEFISIRKK